MHLKHRYHVPNRYSPAKCADCGKPYSRKLMAMRVGYQLKTREGIDWTLTAERPVAWNNWSRTPKIRIMLGP